MGNFLINKILVCVLLMLVSGSAGGLNLYKTDSDDFEIILNNADFSMAYSVSYILHNEELNVVFNGELVGEKPKVLFTKRIKSSALMDSIRSIDFFNMNDSYSNNRVFDGSQVFIRIKKNGRPKNIRVSNYYLREVDLLIKFFNENLPKKYKILYDREMLKELMR